MCPRRRRIAVPHDQSSGKKPITGWARRSQRRRHADDERERQNSPPPHFACDPNLSSLLAQADGLHPQPLEMTRSGRLDAPPARFRGEAQITRSGATRTGVCDLGAGARGTEPANLATAGREPAQDSGRVGIRIPRIVSCLGHVLCSTALARHRCRPVRRSRPQLGVPFSPPRGIVPHAYRRKARKTRLSWRQRESNPRFVPAACA